MTAFSAATPLIALDAVVIDTETTGLDPAKARLIEIGAVRLTSGQVDERTTYRSLVHPGEPIPQAATKIHGIADEHVRDAPIFSRAWPDFRQFAGDAVLIGHTLGFDLAVFRNECARFGIDFVRPRTLDTRLLAQVAAPDLADYTLEGLSAWLGVTMGERHSAVGDAITSARIFRALVPRLRERGIRTLAEAETACRALTDVLDQHHRAGWVEPVHPRRAREDAGTDARVDTYPYRHRVRDVMRTSVAFIDTTATLESAVSRMMKEKISSLYVQTSGTASPPPAADCGIVTERDVLRALVENGPAALGMPVARFMCKPLAVIPADAFVYSAIGRMSRLKIRHLGAADEAGNVIGALSARDLLRLRASEAIVLGDDIEQAEDVHALGLAWARLCAASSSLLSEDVPAREIAAIISRELGALTRRAAVIAERRLAEEGAGAPPCAYSFAVLGSAGRGESLLAMDQDNAIVFAEGEPGGDVDRWFERLGIHVADILDEVGVPYCKGGVMAKNPQWRGSLATWHARVAGWIERSQPDDLLAVDIFFDLLGVHGDNALAETLWRDAFDAARGQAAFAKALVEANGGTQGGLGLFGRIKTEQGRIDLKKHGLFGIVSTARALAICHHVLERATPARLLGIRAMDLGGDRDLDALNEAQAVFLHLILAQQIDDIEHGRPPGNAVLVKSLSARDHERLRAALAAVEPVEQLTRDLLFKG
jgi:DNA polymerase-3 subunit epsilon/CBS domain-containing protein